MNRKHDIIASKTIFWTRLRLSLLGVINIFLLTFVCLFLYVCLHFLLSSVPLSAQCCHPEKCERGLVTLYLSNAQQPQFIWSGPIGFFMLGLIYKRLAFINGHDKHLPDVSVLLICSSTGARLMTWGVPKTTKLLLFSETYPLEFINCHHLV